MMPEDVVKSVRIKFSSGLPMGTHGSFKHEGKMWVAYPAGKYGQIITIIDRLIGIHNRIAADMAKWLNEYPDDAPKAITIMEHVNRANRINREIVDEKMKVNQ